MQLTSYTPAWRLRREAGTPKTNGDVELDVVGNDSDAPPYEHVMRAEGGGYINDSYVHHKEDVSSKM